MKSSFSKDLTSIFKKYGDYIKSYEKSFVTLNFCLKMKNKCLSRFGNKLFKCKHETLRPYRSIPRGVSGECHSEEVKKFCNT